MAFRSWALFVVLLVAGSSFGQERLEVWQIQGDGLDSPYRGSSVITGPNVVTAIGPDVIFVQTPEDRSDRREKTSDGILVVTSNPTSVEIGDLVEVSGVVSEFYGLTQIDGSVDITILASNEPLPEGVLLNASKPSPLQPQAETEMERYEGMRIIIENGVVSGPSDTWGDAVVLSRMTRSFREAGIEYPGLSGFRVWDGNPERFEINPDALGLSDEALAAGTRFKAEGVLAYSYGDYQLWPTFFAKQYEPEFPRPIRHALDSEITVATQNLERLEDDDTDRIAKTSLWVREVLGSPDILALQEIIGLDALVALSDRISADDPSVHYQALYEPGNDIGGINVGFLVEDSVSILGLFQIGKDEVFEFDGSRLNDRPPLVLQARVDGFDLTIVVVHQRSLNGIDDSGSGERVRLKRHDQSMWLATWLQDRQRADPDEMILVVGDFNAFQFSDGYVDVMGILSGALDPDLALVDGEDVIDPNFENLVLDLPEEERYSYVYEGDAASLDHALASSALRAWVSDVVYARGNADASEFYFEDSGTALRVSDHDGLAIFIRPPQVRRGSSRFGR